MDKEITETQRLVANALEAQAKAFAMEAQAHKMAGAIEEAYLAHQRAKESLTLKDKVLGSYKFANEVAKETRPELAERLRRMERQAEKTKGKGSEQANGQDNNFEAEIISYEQALLEYTDGLVDEANAILLDAEADDKPE